MGKKVVYISGPITGMSYYKEAFGLAEELLTSLGHIPLNPAKLPEGMTNEQYMQIDFAMINAADAIYFLPGWENSKGAKLERAYGEYLGKEVWGW